MSKRDQLNRLLDRELEKARREREYHGKTSYRRLKSISDTIVQISMEAWREEMANYQSAAAVAGEQAHG